MGTVAGKEVAPTTGTPHLQIMWSRTHATTWRAQKRLLQRAGLASVSFRVVKRTPDRAAAYCKKGRVLPLLHRLSVDGDFQEWGTPPPAKRGARTDVLALRDAILQGKTKVEIFTDETTAAPAARYTAYVNQLLAATSGKQEKERLKESLREVILRDWQNQVVLDLDEYVPCRGTVCRRQPERKITWCWDDGGNTGKSYLARWLLVWRDAYVVTGGKWADIIYAYGDQRYVVFDLPRDQVEHVPYALIEKFKNGFAFSGKYQSRLRVFPPARVLVLANFEPDRSKLSADRWDVRHVAVPGAAPAPPNPPIAVAVAEAVLAPPASQLGIEIPALVDCD